MQSRTSRSRISRKAAADGSEGASRANCQLENLIYSAGKLNGGSGALIRHPCSAAEATYINARTKNYPARCPPPSARREARAHWMQSHWQSAWVPPKGEGSAAAQPC